MTIKLAAIKHKYLLCLYKLLLALLVWHMSNGLNTRLNFPQIGVNLTSSWDRSTMKNSLSWSHFSLVSQWSWANNCFVETMIWVVYFHYMFMRWQVNIKDIFDKNSAQIQKNTTFPSILNFIDLERQALIGLKKTYGFFVFFFPEKRYHTFQML